MKRPGNREIIPYYRYFEAYGRTLGRLLRKIDASGILLFNPRLQTPPYPYFFKVCPPRTIAELHFGISITQTREIEYVGLAVKITGKEFPHNINLAFQWSCKTGLWNIISHSLKNMLCPTLTANFNLKPLVEVLNRLGIHVARGTRLLLKGNAETRWRVIGNVIKYTAECTRTPKPSRKRKP